MEISNLPAVRSEDDATAFETVFKCVMLDLETRRATDIPDEVQKERALGWKTKQIARRHKR